MRTRARLKLVPLVAGVSLVGGVGLLVGCVPEKTSSLQVSVHNRSDHKVSARLVATGSEQTLASKAVAVGHSHTFAAMVMPRGERVELVIEPREAFGGTVRERVRSGSSEWVVTSPMFSSKGLLELREQREDAGAWTPARAMPSGRDRPE